MSHRRIATRSFKVITHMIVIKGTSIRAHEGEHYDRKDDIQEGIISRKKKMMLESKIMMVDGIITHNAGEAVEVKKRKGKNQNSLNQYPRRIKER